MNTKNESGRMVAIIIAVYVILKVLVNMMLGGSLDISGLLIAAAEAVFLFIGLKYTNYVIAAVLVLVMVVHLGDNIKNISSNLIYLIEGIIDVICAVILCVAGNVREHFSNSLSDLTGGA